jgi:hypothetical protein
LVSSNAPKVRIAPTSSKAVATKNVCTMSSHALQRESSESMSAPTPTCTVKLASTRAVSGVRVHGQKSIATRGTRKTSRPPTNAPTPKTRAATSAARGTTASRASGTPESVVLFRHQRPKTANGERM